MFHHRSELSTPVFLHMHITPNQLIAILGIQTELPCWNCFCYVHDDVMMLMEQS